LDPTTPAPTPAVPPPPPPGGPRLPATLTGKVGLALIAAAAAWLSYRNQFEAAASLVGVACWLLGMSREQAAATAFAFRAAVNSEHAATSSARANLHAVETKEIATEAAAAATQAASTGEVVKDALRDIQDNPNMPGTPGFLARND
jgi:hypothetical protein